MGHEWKYPDDWKHGGPGIAAGVVISGRVLLGFLVVAFVGVLLGWW